LTDPSSPCSRPGFLPLSGLRACCADTVEHAIRVFLKELVHESRDRRSLRRQRPRDGILQGP